MSEVLKFNPSNTENVEPLTLTPDAVAYIQKTIKQRGSGKGLRLTVKKTGCSGYAYLAEILDDVTADDRVFLAEDGLLIAVPQSVLDLVAGTRIDYTQTNLKGGFEFDNPKQKGVCGCGESFTL
jgi:iron-sulfur cluster assembly protein